LGGVHVVDLEIGAAGGVDMADGLGIGGTHVLPEDVIIPVDAAGGDFLRHRVVEHGGGRQGDLGRLPCVPYQELHRLGEDAARGASDAAGDGGYGVLERGAARELDAETLSALLDAF